MWREYNCQAHGQRPHYKTVERTVGDLKGLGSHDATPAEGAGLEAGYARLEARLGGGAALLVGCAAG